MVTICTMIGLSNECIFELVILVTLFGNLGGGLGRPKFSTRQGAAGGFQI